jgi:hypothetical protein
MFVSESPHPDSIKDIFRLPAWHNSFPFHEGIFKASIL